MGRCVPIEPFELLRHGKELVDNLLLASSFAKPRLVRDGLRQGHRIGRIGRNQLAQTVNLAIGHLQDAADVTQDGARLQRSEGDDLCDLLPAVFLLHIADHLFTPALAEVDIEIRHGHAFRVQKALEQEGKPHGVEIGDRQGPGNKRPCAGPAARANRDILVLAPLDEIGNDQKVAGELHPVDDAQLVIEPFPIVLLGQARGEAMSIQSCLKAFARLPLQFLSLGPFGLFPVGVRAGKAGKDRITAQGPETAALRNLYG